MSLSDNLREWRHGELGAGASKLAAAGSLTFKGKK